MGISAEFASYGAKLVNVQWAVSALANGELVLSLWSHRMTTQPDGSWIYRDKLSRWSGHGNKLFGEHLRDAIENERPIRLVMARSDNVALIESGGDASKAKNTFKARPERLGKIVEFDGDNFSILFAPPAARAT